MDTYDYPIVDVTGVRVLDGYVVELTFDDGAVKVVDIEPWLVGPAFQAVRDDYGQFQAVTVSAGSGTIEFPNGADLSPAGLYLRGVTVVPGRRRS